MYNNTHYNFDILFLLLALNLPVTLLVLRKIKVLDLRIYYILFSTGFYFYSGLGAGYEIGVAQNYLLYFTVFNYIYCFTFLFFYRKSSKQRLQKNYRFDLNIQRFVYSNGALFIIWAYFIAITLQMVFPDFILFRLFAPPKPDIIGNLRGRFSNQSVSLISSTLTYIQTILYPFVTICLFRYYKRIPLFIFLNLLPLYFEYCTNAYIGRSAILMKLIFVVILLYKFRPDRRKLIVTSTAIIVPFLLVLGFVYQYARLGAIDLARNVTIADATANLFDAEIVYPTLSAEIIDKDRRVDLPEYLLWVGTLPFPKFGMIKVDGGLPGYEISEIVTGKQRTSQDFNVLLSGFLTESIYVYGKLFFWLNAFLTAYFSVLIGRFLSTSKVLFGVSLLFAIIFGYNLNRAGVQSALPFVTSVNLILYIFIYFKYKRA